MISPAKIEIRPSAIVIGEVGLFSISEFKVDDIVILASTYEDDFIPWEEFSSLDRVTQKKVMDFCPGRSDGFFAPKSFDHLTISWYMNHSCNPNIGFDNEYNFIAMAHIKPGDELLWDYAYDESNPNFRLECKCGTPTCRGVVSGLDWRDHVNIGFNYNYLSPHIKEIIEKS